MVNYVRIGEARIHVPLSQSAEPASARIYFVGPADLPKTIDPAQEFLRGTVVLAPRLSAPLWTHIINNLSAIVDHLNSNGRCQIVLLSDGGGPRPDGQIRVGNSGVSETSEYVEVGSPEFDSAWQIVIPEGTHFSGDATCLSLTLPPEAGLELPGGKTVPILSTQDRCQIDIDWDGPARGAFRFRALVSADQLEALGAGPRYFSRSEGEADPGKILISRFSYPLFALGEGKSELFDFQIDCASPHDDEPHGLTEEEGRRPRSMLTPPDHALPTHLHQVHAGEVLMKPAEAHGQPKGFFALTSSPRVLDLASGSAQLQRGAHYFTPMGAFAVQSEDPAREQLRLTLGLSHLENMTVCASDRLVFERFRPAYESLKNIELAAAGTEAEAAAPLEDLNGMCTTSWLRLAPGLGVEAEADPFSLQPEGMQAYVSSSADGRVMDFREVRYPNAGGALPLAPLLGVKGDAGAYGHAGAPERLQFERRVLALARRREITGGTKNLALAGAAEAEPVAARTPQGYLTSRTGSARAWNRIVFTKTSLRQDDAGAFPELDPVGIGISAPEGSEAAGHLASVLAQNRLMLVTTWKKLDQLHFDLNHFGRIHVGGWGIRLNPRLDPVAEKEVPALPAGFDPIVIIKYADRSIADLAGDESQWALRDTFSDPSTRQRFKVAIADSSKDLRQPLARRLNDPNWNGLLILDALLPLTGIPEQMRAIAGGLPDYIEVPYAGLDITGIDPKQQDDEPWKSALFGLVLHDNAETKFSEDGTTHIGMRVPKLVVRVENDGIDRFDCNLELHLPGLFDLNATNPEDDLKLEGRYESSVVDGRRRENYTFLAEGEFKKTFDASSVVESATFRSLRLVTTANEGRRTVGSFMIDGSIAFNKVLDSDLFGIKRLDFTDLAIDLDFRIGTLDKIKLNLNYPKLKLDLDLFNSGEGCRGTPGFLKAFPLKLRGFRFGEFKLPDLGFLSLGSLVPDGSSRISDHFKFGFDFDMDLGSLGALAGKLDRFKLQIVLGWKPRLEGDSRWNDIAAGFRIDFGKGGGGIDLGVQGILRLWAERFNLKRVGDVFVLSADDCHIDILGKVLPEQGQTFSMYLFANPKGGEPFERLGWFGSFNDKQATDPLKIESLVLAQRVDVNFDSVSTTSKALKWLNDAQDFSVPGGTEKFVQFAGDKITYDRNREWFLALKGDFFKVLRLGLVLKDPDMYGVYLGFLATDDSPQSAPMSFDLLYQKLADGVGRYSVEVGLPPGYRTFECGVVSVTLGMIRMEVYTDGGFLFDLGFPEQVDYTRSFAVQAGIFIGKGGLYLGRVPAVTVPKMPEGYLQVFRSGFAMKVGFGREFEQGPLRAGLSICVFGRMEGYFAIADNGQLAPDGKTPLAPYPYWMRLHGEVGLIAEIEGCVDLRLIRARVLVRVWIATGIVLETALPIVLYCEAGVSVALEFEIASFKVFGKRIRITVMLRFSTTLRYEFQLPAKVPVFKLPGVAEAMALAAPEEERPPLGAWPEPLAAQFGVPAQPIDLRLGYDFTAAGRDGTAEGGHVGTVLVPTVMWMTGDEHNKDGNPFETIARALIAWAALRAQPAFANASHIKLRKDLGTELDLRRLEESLNGLDDMPFATLEGFFTVIAPGSRLRHIPEGDKQAAGFLFPVPPRLAVRMTWDGGEETCDFAKRGLVTAQTLNGIFADLQRQFAEIEARSRSAAMAEADEPQPLVDYIFRSWCTALALSACDAARTAWKPEEGASTTRTVGAFLDALTPSHWNDIASRAGRLLLSGARTSDNGVSRPLAEMAGLFMAFPKGAATTKLDPVEGQGPAWLAVQADSMEVQWAALAAVASATVVVQQQSTVVPSARLVARRFYQPPSLAVRENGANPTAYLCRFSGDFFSSGAATPLEKLAFSAAKTSDQVGQLPADSMQLQSARAALVFEMTLARLPVEGGAGLAEAAAPKSMPSAFRISGASEADRLGLDALIEGMAAPGSTLSLDGTRLLVGWREGAEPTASLALLPLAAGEMCNCVVARSTVSIERRPAEKLAVLEAEAEEKDPENRFLATFEPASRYQLLYLLRRAAIVNAEGTNLLLPEAQAKLVRELFEKAEAGRRTIRLMFAVVFAPGTVLPPSVRNAALFEDAADLQLIAQPDRRIVAELAQLPAAADSQVGSAAIVEAISTRPAGTELVRTWRQRSDVNGASAATDAALGAHLAQRFDMLEFQLRRAGSAEPLLSFAHSLPLGSEVAVPLGAKPDGEGAPYPALLREQLAADLPSGYEADDLRYDLIVPLSRLCDATGNPYAAIGQEFELELGWRDVYGNRLGMSGDLVPLKPHYTDPVVPLASWPCIKARVHPGGNGSRTLVLALSVDEKAIPVSKEDRLAAANELRRVIFQVSDKNAEPKVRCGLGDVAGKLDVAKLVDELLKPVEASLRANQEPAANEWKHNARVAVSTRKNFLPLSLEFSVMRPEALVASADGKPPMVPGIAAAWSPVRMDSIAGARPEKPDFQRDFATEFQLAFTFAEGGRTHRFWAALGTVQRGGQDWWVMNDRVIPEPSPAPPVAYGVPPMARALMSGQVIAQVAQEPDYETQKELRALVRDKDVDALLAAFLDRVETFISPAHAHCTALAGATAGTKAPFESVARAKAELLGKADESSPLLQALRTVFVREPQDAEADRYDAALAELREACAPDLRRFYEVGCVMVKDLKPRLEPDWVKAKGHLRPKLYGQLKFANAAGQAASFRTMTRGIPLDPKAMQIALPVIPDLQSDASEADLGQIDYEMTHVEREVTSEYAGVLQASRWLTLVPVLGAQMLPSIRVSSNDKAPLPRRRVPAATVWGKHTFEHYAHDTVAPTYEAHVQAARRWTYGFEVEAEFAGTDEVCCRLLYNLPTGSASAAGEAPQSAAQPVIEQLFDKLAAHELEVAPYWNVIMSEGKRRAAGEEPLEAFIHACNRFAESVERVLGAFRPHPRWEGEAKVPDQDRFILTDEAASVGGSPGRKTTIRFADHFVGEKPVDVLAGDGQPWLRIQRVLADSQRDGSPAGVGANGQGINRGDVRAEFAFAGTDEKGPDRRSREVMVGRLDALRQQSVWVAASVRRNRLIGGKPLDEAFVYRTPETFLHQAMSPQLLHRKPILLVPTAPLTLENLIAQGLRPVLKDVGAERGAYVQLSADYESGRLTELVEASFGAAGTDKGFALQPDPKMILAATKVSGEASVEALANMAATRLHEWFKRESIGKAADGSRGRIVLNVTVSAVTVIGPEQASPGQTILQLERLGLDLTKVSDL